MVQRTRTDKGVRLQPGLNQRGGRGPRSIYSVRGKVAARCVAMVCVNWRGMRQVAVAVAMAMAMAMAVVVSLHGFTLVVLYGSRLPPRLWPL